MTDSDSDQSEHENDDDQWTSCCGSSHSSEAIRYFSQVGISSAVMSFAMYQLVNDPSSAQYMSLLTMVLGVWLPSPKRMKIS
jgi:hypothetical protein